MKKILFIGIGFALAIAVFAGAGLAYAQTQNPPPPGAPMGMPPAPAGDDPLGDYMIPAMAEIFGLTEEQTAALQLSRETMESLQAEMSPEEMQAAMQQVFTLAVENALADGVITQEQADQMLARAQRQGARLPGMTPPNPRTDPRSRAAEAYKQAFEAGKRIGRQEAILRPYVEAAIADYLNVSVEELQQMREDGLTWQSYAEEQGLSDEEIRDLRVELFTTAINNAVADGTITQEQADRMLEHLQNPVRRPGAPGGMPGGMPPQP